MANDIKTSVVVDLKGNLSRQLKRNEKNIERFAKNSSRSMKGLSRNTKIMNGTITSMGKKMAALAAAAASVRNISKVMDFDAGLTQLQTDGQASVEQIAALKKELISLANDPNIRLDKNTLLSGFNTIIEQAAGFDRAFKNLRNLGEFIRATKSDARDAGAMIAVAFKTGINDELGVKKYLATQYKQSLEGAVPIREIAKIGKGLYAPMTAVAGNSPEVLTSTGALNQITIDSTKSADEAQEAIKSFAMRLVNKDVQKILKKAGVNMRRPNSKDIRLPHELVPEIYKAAGGDFGKLNKLFGESAVKIFLGYSKEGGAKRLKELASINEDGSLLSRNARINAGTAKAAAQSVSNKVSEMFDAVISTPTKDIAKAMDNFQKTDAWLNTKAIGYSAASVVAAPLDYTHKQFNTLADFTVGNAIRGVKSLFNGSDEKAQTSKVELEIKSDTPVVVKSIKSNNIDVTVDSGVGMSGN